MEEFEEKELYLECLGHLIGLEFEPRSGLKLKERAQDNEGGCGKKLGEREHPRQDIVLSDLPVDKVRTWKKGAMTDSLLKFGYGQPSSSLEQQQVRDRSKLLERFRFRSKNTVKETRNENQYASQLQRQENVQNGGYKGNKNVLSHGCITDDTMDLVHQPIKTRGIGTSRRQISDGGSSTSRQFVMPLSSNLKNSPKLVEQAEPKSTNDTNGGFKGLFSTCSRNNESNTELITAVSGNRKGRYENHNTRVDERTKPTDNNEDPVKSGVFRSAYEQLRINDKAKGIKRNLDGGPRDTAGPVANKNKSPLEDTVTPKISDNAEVNELMMTHESLKMFEPAIVERILAEIMEPPQEIGWDDVAGLEGPKSIIKEIIIWPLLRPDIFKGLRAAPRGILLFGPPGTGKTMIGRLISTQSKSTFFSISASSLTSKWIGDGEKIVRALFVLARIKQPSVIFIDEIDSIMTQRSDTEHESSRRMKTEFLVQFDGCSTDSEDRVLVIGVTNRPQELDDAARRRLVKRIYIPLPDLEGRKQIVQKLMADQSAKLSEEDYVKIAEITDGYSGADMKNLCHVAANEPIRDISDNLEFIDIADVRPIQLEDFLSAKEECSKTVAGNEMTIYEDFDKAFGCKKSLRKKN